MNFINKTASALGFSKTYFFIAAAALLVIVVIFGAFADFCGRRRLEKLGNTANRSADNQKTLEGERKEINREANHDLREIREEKEKSNANINQALSNVNNVRNAFGNHNFSADELERLANRRRQ